MRPPKREYEKVEVDTWINGRITEIEYKVNPPYKSPSSGKEYPAVRIALELEGYKQPKRTPFMLFSYAKSSNLYALFVESLVEGAYEYMDLDLDQLKDLRVKVMFEQKGDYQNILRIRPREAKAIPAPVEDGDPTEPGNGDKVPF